MNYIYSDINRLKTPHNYMYTSFDGENFLKLYLSSRMDVINREIVTEAETSTVNSQIIDKVLPMLASLFQARSIDGFDTPWTLLLNLIKFRTSQVKKKEENCAESFDKNIEIMSGDEQVKTLDLLHGLIAAQLINIHTECTKSWLDRLVQRFEVTKKIYEVYLPGFRKGDGTNESIYLYWLFALALCIFYARSNEIKYLGTLLKVNDLLCSLPENDRRIYIPEHGLATILVAEVLSIQLLAKRKGVIHAFK